MNYRNCPNCGAALDAEVSKCPYCGTSYFDLCSVNIDDGEPFWLKIKTNFNGKPLICTMLVRAEPSLTMTMEEESIDLVVSDYCHTIRRAPTVSLDMHFISISQPTPNNVYARFEYDPE